MFEAMNQRETCILKHYKNLNKTNDNHDGYEDEN